MTICETLREHKDQQKMIYDDDDNHSDEVDEERWKQAL